MERNLLVPRSSLSRTGAIVALITFDDISLFFSFSFSVNTTGNMNATKRRRFVLTFPFPGMKIESRD